MNALGQIAHLLSTDLTFRQAFLVDPDGAIALQGLSLDDEAKAALTRIHRLLATSPQELAGQLFRTSAVYGSWGGFTLENELTPQRT
jgi:hypothetical protein